MHLVQILLPTHDNSQEPFPRDDYREVRRELTARFGGLTVYTRAPAEGHWKLNENHTSRDDIVIFEVMASELEEGWWRNYRLQLEKRFRQDVIFVHAQPTQLLQPGAMTPAGARSQFALRVPICVNRVQRPRLQRLDHCLAQRAREIVLYPIENAVHKTSGIRSAKRFCQFDRFVNRDHRRDVFAVE